MKHLEVIKTVNSTKNVGAKLGERNGYLSGLERGDAKCDVWHFLRYEMQPPTGRRRVPFRYTNARS